MQDMTLREQAQFMSRVSLLIYQTIFSIVTATIITGLIMSFFLVDSATLAQDSTATPTAIAPGTIATDRTDTEMVYVPSATFEMGIDEERLIEVCEENFSKEPTVYCVNQWRPTSVLAEQEVQIFSFWLDRFEVTFAQYQECVDMGRCPPHIYEYPENLQEPIADITWNDALNYCLWRSARLPTEAEWEYAASGADKNVFSWGNDPFLEVLGIRYQVSPVGTTEQDVSWVGVYDMTYNVSEWTESRYIPYANFDGEWDWQDADLMRVVRGGSRGSDIYYTFNFTRQGVFPSMRRDIGIRCARFSNPQS